MNEISPFVAGPPRPSRILRPGLLTLPDNVERYVAEGGGSVIVEVDQGDRVEVIDKEGRQPCELIGIGAGGKFNDAVLSARADCDAEGFKEILANGDDSAGRAAASLKRRNIDISACRAVRVLGKCPPATGGVCPMGECLPAGFRGASSRDTDGIPNSGGVGDWLRQRSCVFFWRRELSGRQSVLEQF